MPAPYNVTYGGWYQRTTLHLSEIYEFFVNANSFLNLDKSKLKNYQQNLKITSVTRELSYLEYVKATTKDGIEIRYYEDGLYVLELNVADVKTGRDTLEQYFNNYFNPAINYIFSLGAPTPKILANIKTVHPTVVSFDPKQIPGDKVDSSLLKDIYSQIEDKNVAVYKSRDFIFILADASDAFPVNEIVEMQIFFREFKDQLEKYLNIHRKIWGEIADIKERKFIKAKEVGTLRERLDTYQKTISLISNRINQMGSYVKTRKAVSKNLQLESHLENLFQYRFDVLVDTLDYIKEIWKMTTDYVTSAIQVLVEIQSAATNKSIQSLTLITSVGVLSGLIAYLSRDTFPKVTFVGFIYLSILIICGYLFNFIVQRIQLNKLQKLKFSKTDENI